MVAIIAVDRAVVVVTTVADRVVAIIAVDLVVRVVVAVTTVADRAAAGAPGGAADAPTAAVTPVDGVTAVAAAETGRKARLLPAHLEDDTRLPQPALIVPIGRFRRQ